jgi:hypothetical protein
MESTDSLPSLQDSTVTGGRLNLHRSLQSFQTKQQSLLVCPPVWYIQASQRTDSSLLLNWAHLLINLPVNIRYREAGTSQWNSFNAFGQNTPINSLSSCQLYEIQAATICTNDTSVYSRSVFVESEGCCRPPSQSEITSLTENEVTINWDPVYAAQSYVLEYRIKDSMQWTSISLSDTAETLQNLAACTFFEYRTAIQCDTGLSAFSPIQQFRTRGCGQCEEGTYCSSMATDPQEDDWIESFQLDTLINISGPNDGYKNFSDLSIPLKAGETYSFRLEPGFATLSFSEYWRIWIDYNQDGDFSDSLELAYDGFMTTDTAVTGQLTVPADLFSGPTRLRVSMQFLFAPEPCGNFQFGEVEDYCVEIDGRGRKLEDEQVGKLVKVYPNPTDGKIFIEAPYRELHWELFDLVGRELKSGFSSDADFEISLSGMRQGIYLLIIRGKEGIYSKKVILE